jgi:class 3 adenylate cyclase
MNVMLLRDDGSDTVASNVPGNIEEADPEEHEDLLKSLEYNQPVVVIEHPSDDVDPDDEPIDETHPDYYISSDWRIIGITTPLAAGGYKYGSINVKTSLASIDQHLNRFRRIILIAAIAEILIVILGLGILLTRQIFHPLRYMTRTTQRIAGGDMNEQLPTAERRDEIGVLSAAFNSMVRQLKQARNQLHQYLNPLAIEEAYRRAGDQDIEPLAEEREVSILFIDIVSFTATSERLGPSGTVAYLNRYFDLISSALIDLGGRIDKFVADEIICIFDEKYHADQAVSAARVILKLLTTKAFTDQIRVRIGINTGTCIIADIGSQAVGRLDRTVIGDTVNIAQRLMTNTEPNSAMLSFDTFRALIQSVPDIYPAGEQKLKGRDKSVAAYQLIIRSLNDNDN